jgi:methionyl-tRNA synthetase
VKLSNLYIDKNAPWQLAKEKTKQKELHDVLYNLLETLRILALILFPFIPDSAQKIWTQLGIEGNIEDQILDKAIIWGQLKPGTKVKEGPPLFPRIQESV